MKRTWDLGASRVGGLTNSATLEIDAYAADLTRENIRRLRYFVEVLGMEAAIHWPDATAAELPPAPPNTARGNWERLEQLAKPMLDLGARAAREAAAAVPTPPLEAEKPLAATSAAAAAPKVEPAALAIVPPEPTADEEEKEEEELNDDGEPIPGARASPPNGTPRPQDVPTLDPEDIDDEPAQKPFLLAGKEWPSKKRCSKCKTEKSRATGFNKNAGKYDGLNTECKTCQAGRFKNKNLEPANPKPAPSLRCKLCADVIPASTHQLHLETKHGKTLPARAALAYFGVG